MNYELWVTKTPTHNWLYCFFNIVLEFKGLSNAIVNINALDDRSYILIKSNIIGFILKKNSQKTSDYNLPHEMDGNSLN